MCVFHVSGNKKMFVDGWLGWLLNLPETLGESSVVGLKPSQLQWHDL